MSKNKYNTEGKKEGYWEEYWDNGNIWYKGNFTNDNYHGYWEWHFKNGDIWYKEYHLED